MTQTIKTILLVDDDADDQLLFQEALSEANSAIAYFSAADGIDALEKLVSGNISLPDLLFMDVNMPRMNGIDCLIELKKKDALKGIPIIMYSTSCSAEYQNKCLENGAIAYMEKPNDFWQLCSKLKAIVNKGLDTPKILCP